MSALQTTLDSIATAVPPVTVRQEGVLKFMDHLDALPADLRRRLEIIYRRSGIERRHSCLADYDRPPEEFEFYPSDPSQQPVPTTGDRNQAYRRWALPLAEEAARGALESAACLPAEVTHLIYVTCTGFYAPGPEIELVQRLGLRPDTERTLIGFMGCYAAFNGLRTADALCRSRPGSRVLLVCLELSTLHFQTDPNLENMIVNSIFADGAAATVLTSRPSSSIDDSWIYRGGRSELVPDSADDMTWDIADTGFRMTLSPRVPDRLGSLLPSFVDDLLAPHAIGREAVDFWAVHPGGRRILDRSRESLGIEPDRIRESYEILREYGNMSSPTILFILERILFGSARSESNAGVALAFGPGLTLEGCLLTRG